MSVSLRIWNSTLNSYNGQTYPLHCIWNMMWTIEAFKLSLDATHLVVVVRITFFFNLTYSINWILNENLISTTKSSWHKTCTQIMNKHGYKE
jgi:hypothetical protein